MIKNNNFLEEKNKIFKNSNLKNSSKKKLSRNKNFEDLKKELLENIDKMKINDSKNKTYT